ncbi:ABC transporter ATP-binding protein [Clostridium chauvoei]|uniref:ABC transporter ATP-binding protein n=2 Tax=Clostridium chauvoei TaxID=46867 RepID=A0ABD4RHV7_9CLOT|nr:ABC transporter ATP-binding protein [Clostridium chauvoei]ATD55394.1 spermidine/putrescine ABC transporter ATP-binding protein [Clostridium chauvoei]ATD56935.1 spermidine/putrescine ABC transporter ATP-binding protein [Clostridium chauvoei]MBX7280777.1 ABC transporter ATP-binding protein [Clostridium chauvoei]MBX7283261.1 ABC transporter ATP-binding protein [Clostridium chauvoei]MBX7285855.1 ABC transporter ATP-binding protein [Clostridium chauvoei]
MNLIEVSNIRLTYQSLKGETEAIKEVNFTVPKGEFVSIIGPSGCGKSTLLNIISGLLEPSGGEVIYNDKNIKNRLDKMGYMFQKDYLFEWLTVWDNVLLGLKVKKLLNKENIERVEKLLENYDLAKFKDHKPNELSGGMRQRVALIRTLALSPEVLLLDEPFSALDYQTRLKVCDEVTDIIKKEEKTAIMVTHDLGEAIATSDRIIMLTKRPSKVKLDIKIEFENKEATPFQRRKEPEFNEYFNLLWKELDKCNE